MTETRKLCWMLRCGKSGLPSLLPLDTLRQLIQDRGIPPKDYPDIAFLCPHCTCIETHSLDPGSPYYRTSGKAVESTQSEDVFLLICFESCEGCCTFRLPIIAASNSPTAFETMQKDWSYLRCPSGHPILFPQE